MHINLIASILSIAVTAYIAICCLLYWQQDKIVFPGASNTPSILNSFSHERLTLSVNGAELEGFKRDLSQHNPNSDLTLLYFGGNAEDIGYILQQSQQFNARNIYSFNYRSYGSSTGSPSEQTLKQDAEQIFSFLLKDGVSAGNIVLIGRSLGTSIAVHTAAFAQHRQQSVAAIVLTTPYDSLVEIGRHHYPWLPVSWLFKHPFNTIADTTNVHSTALFLIAGQDRIIPAKHGKRLHQHWQGSSQLSLFPQANHNSINQHNNYFSAINKFLQSELAD